MHLFLLLFFDENCFKSSRGKQKWNKECIFYGHLKLKCGQNGHCDHLKKCNLLTVFAAVSQRIFVANFMWICPVFKKIMLHVHTHPVSQPTIHFQFYICIWYLCIKKRKDNTYNNESALCAYILNLKHWWK